MEDNKRHREDDGEAPDSKRRHIDGLLQKLTEDKVVERLPDITDKIAQGIASPPIFFHTITQLFRCIFKQQQQQQSKMGSYSALAGLVAQRAQQLYGNSADYSKAFEWGDRMMRITVEMLDRNLSGGVWMKTMVLMKFAADLMHVRILHPQNMWNILREIVNEVLSSSNSSNRRDAYCYMVLSTLQTCGKSLADYEVTLKERNLTKEELPDCDLDDGGEHSAHHDVDLKRLFEDIKQYMKGRESERQSAQAVERLEQSWTEVKQLVEQDWAGCDAMVQPQPYSVPEIRNQFPQPIPLPVVTLKKMKARTQKADKEKGENAVEAEENKVQNYANKIAQASRAGNYEEAIRLWSELRQARVKLSRNAYVAILSVYAAKQEPKQAQQIFDAMTSPSEGPAFRAGAVEYKILLKAYEFACDEKIFDVYEAMKKAGISADTATLTTMVSACEVLGKPEKASELLNEMKELNLQPDNTLLCAFLRTCQEGADVDQATKLFQTFTSEYGVQPNADVYASLGNVFKKSAEYNAGRNRNSTSTPTTTTQTKLEDTLATKEEPVKQEEQPTTVTPDVAAATDANKDDTAPPEKEQEQQQQEVEPAAAEEQPPQEQTQPPQAVEPQNGQPEEASGDAEMKDVN